MDRLPPELLLEIISHLVPSEDHKCVPGCPYISRLRSLASTSRLLHQLATPQLYIHDATYAGRAILHGAVTGSATIIALSQAWGGDINRSGLLRLPGYHETATGTPLLVAVKEGHLSVAKYLVRHGANLNKVGMNLCNCQHSDYPYWPASPWTSLHLALCQEHSELAEFLVAAGAQFCVSREELGIGPDGRHFRRGNQVVVRSSTGVHLIDEVAKRANLRVLKFLVQHCEGKLRIDQYSADSTTPLHHAACITDNLRELEMIRTLLDHGALLYPSNYVPGRLVGPLPFDRAFLDWVKRFDRSSKHVLPGRGHPYSQLLAFLKYMKEGGRDHLRPLMARILELWMDRGPARLDSAWSLLYQAFGLFDTKAPEPGVIREWVLRSIRSPKLEPLGPMSVVDVLEFIPKLGFSLTLLEPVNELFLEAGALALRDECVWFLKNGADINARTGDGRTALHLAARSGDLDQLEMLLSWGADAEARDRGGHAGAHGGAVRSARGHGDADQVWGGRGVDALAGLGAGSGECAAYEMLLGMKRGLF
ncbi:unnamed protein product [Parascedosporium putredinis]|uniref:Ankyrin n=1 Tax=Parascedosporium putredinis TaxID=1442378 RepID=A0A9P1MAA5_9PEZI|nr:unnamed protein product [Parascedosporium putredinis]CAI7996243.1 unnamed protein product [Parascedosporium putredinis]